MTYGSIFTLVIPQYIPEPHATLLNGIVFGSAVKNTKELYGELQRVGLLHMVVLSGTNIVFLASFIRTICIYFGRRVSYLITILVLVFYIYFVGFEAPITRATIMGIITYVGLFMGRRTATIYCLFLSLLVIALLFPRWLTSISLYLSFGATLGLVLFSGKKLPIFQSQHPLLAFIGEELQISLAAQIFTVPIIFLYFKQISFISPIANILVSFTIGPLMLLGLLSAFLGKVWFPLGALPAYLAYGITSYFIYITHLLSKIPFAFTQF